MVGETVATMLEFAGVGLMGLVLVSTLIEAANALRKRISRKASDVNVTSDRPSATWHRKPNAWEERRLSAPMGPHVRLPMKPMNNRGRSTNDE